MMPKKELLILCLSLSICAACSGKGGRSSASLPIAATNASLRLERISIHDFLAEYDRYLVLIVGGVPVTRTQISTDTGGKSRANVFFRKADSTLVLQDWMGRYEINVAQRNISEVSSTCREPEGNVFVGAFDVDETKEWRFIPAAERKQMPVPASGCGEI
ncbi:MAG TPA: hypothetical protein VGB61_07940 [Pyrinomonadaceae bacterium]